MVAVSRLAPAKVNLFLHVGPVEPDGFHPLASLVAFADLGDRVSMEPAERLSLTVTGPFAASLDGQGDNLILAALRALGRVAGTGDPAFRVTLDKQLPIAAGLGGGSSDAGAALKLARTLLDLTLDDDALAEIAGQIGADGAMCLHARSAWAEGRGDRLTFEPALPALPALLINPGAPSPTGAVYRAYDEGRTHAADTPSAPPDWRLPTVIDWLAAGRNDLQKPAVQRQPLIGTALDSAAALPEVRLVRMSGSGATVFALFDTIDAARVAGAGLKDAFPAWWIKAALLG